MMSIGVHLSLSCLQDITVSNWKYENTYTIRQK